MTIEDLTGVQDAISRTTRLLLSNGEHDVELNNDESVRHTVCRVSFGKEQTELELIDEDILRVRERGKVVLDVLRTHTGERLYGDPVVIDGHRYAVNTYARGPWQDLVDKAYLNALL